jgi:hypothetical protein
LRLVSLLQHRRSESLRGITGSDGAAQTRGAPALRLRPSRLPELAEKLPGLDPLELIELAEFSGDSLLSS